MTLRIRTKLVLPGVMPDGKVHFRKSKAALAKEGPPPLKAPTLTRAVSLWDS